MKDVLSTQFNSDVNQYSPCIKEYGLQFVKDEDGNLITVYQEVNSLEVYKSRGSVFDWRLDDMLAAGINPDIRIHTSFTSPFDAQSVINDQMNAINSSFVSESNESNVEN